MRAKTVNSKDILNEKRCSLVEIPFIKQDVADKVEDAKFYVKEIEDNLVKVDTTSVPFKFDVAFDKLQKTLDTIFNATKLGQTNEELNNRMLYSENKNKDKSNKYPLSDMQYESDDENSKLYTGAEVLDLLDKFAEELIESYNEYSLSPASISKIATNKSSEFFERIKK